MWQAIIIVLVLLVISAFAVLAAWIWRSGMSTAQATSELRALGIDLVRLPGRLRRVASDPRTPRRARWMLIGLAIYVASPVDIIPDFLPIIGQLDEVIIVPLVLTSVRRLVPDEVWNEHFPPRDRRVHSVG